MTELDVRPEPEVVDPDGQAVADATVVARGGFARLDGVETATTDENGTIEFDVKPPAGSECADDRKNTAMLVVES